MRANPCRAKPGTGGFEARRPELARDGALRIPPGGAAGAVRVRGPVSNLPFHDYLQCPS